jgi:hypothetical protein
VDGSQYASSLDRFFQRLTERIQASKFATTKHYERGLKDFFTNFSFRRKALLSVKKEADILLSSDFNVFHFIAPDENKISDILADMMNPCGRHGQSDVFLREFLSTLQEKGVALDIDSLLNIPTAIRATREVLISGYRRIDIIVEFRGQIAIGIENKPWAGDQKDQVKDYCAYLDSKSRNYYLVYLQGEGVEPSDYSVDFETLKKLKENGRLITMSYSEDMKEWISRCHMRCKSERYRYFLLDFLEYLNRNFRRE